MRQGGYGETTPLQTFSDSLATGGVLVLRRHGNAALFCLKIFCRACPLIKGGGYLKLLSWNDFLLWVAEI